MIAPKKLKSVQNHLKMVINRSIESNEEDIIGFKKWIKILQTEPRKAIRRLKRRTKQKYKFLEKEMNKELECFEQTGIASENLKKFQEEKIASANKSINTTKIRIRRDRRRLKMVENNLSNLLKEMDKTHLVKNIEAELICYERKFKMQKLLKKSK